MTDDTFELTLEAMAHGGRAMGKHDGRPVFVPYTIPGERILAHVTQDKGSAVIAEGTTLLDSSADRVYPRCPHFGPGRCGRCQWQHIDYPAQLLLKQDVLADQLERIAGLKNPPVQPVIASPDQWGYSYHLTLTAAPDGSLGLPGADGGVFAPIDECHILHPDLMELYTLLDLEQEGVRRLKLQMGTDGARMVILTTDDDNAPELETDLPASVNLLLSDNEPVNLIGDSHSRYTIDGITFRVTAGSSFRANVGQLPILAETVMRLLDLRGSEAVLDLYAGVGFFSGFIAPRAGLATLVESYPPAVTDADENLAAFDNVDVYEGGVEAVLSALDERYDAAVVDPPSNGLGERVVRLLAGLGVQRLVYVSGDPPSLAHDCKQLARAGYRLVTAQPLDFAPQTYYLDTAALFESVKK